MTNTYYKKHNIEFINSTKNCDMHELYDRFESYLKDDSKKILDVGFGSGRDSIYFSKKYNVYSLDPSIEFCEYGKSIGLKNIINKKIEDIDEIEVYDGIWACASLLHVSSKDIKDTFFKCYKALKNDGIMYVSFKYGDFEGIRNERYYLDMNESKFKEIIKDTCFIILEEFNSLDVRDNNNTRWFNAIIKKNLMFNTFDFIKISEHKEYIDIVSEWYSKKYNKDINIFKESMIDSLNSSNGIPEWIICIYKNKIIGGIGLIELPFSINPFIVYLKIEDNYSKLNIEETLIHLAEEHAYSKDIKTLYLFNNKELPIYLKLGFRKEIKMNYLFNENNQIYFKRIKN